MRFEFIILCKLFKLSLLFKLFKIGFSTDNEIHAIWALAKNPQDKKGKRNFKSRERKKGRKEGKSK